MLLTHYFLPYTLDNKYTFLEVWYVYRGAETSPGTLM